MLFIFTLKQNSFAQHYQFAKKWYKCKANVGLGAFIVLFALNQAYLFPGLFTFIIVAILVILGIFVILENVKKARHYGQFVEEEFQINQ